MCGWDLSLLCARERVEGSCGVLWLFQCGGFEGKRVWASSSMFLVTSLSRWWRLNCPEVLVLVLTLPKKH